MIVLPRPRLGVLPGLLLVSGLAGAQFTVNSSRLPSGAPFNNSSTENVDFADVDLDGDWDIAMADGGDDGNDQNRIWINRGGAQGGPIGFYVDETSSRFPIVSDDSRDIEFVDFDEDGDVDLYTSNTAQLSNQGNRWWVNCGGIQGATIGEYADETSSRWVNLGVLGQSSIPPSLLIGGTFIDWSCDCDFGDLDNDGDLDLVHSSYGGSFGGTVPTRIFLNDGGGHFAEFDPSGFRLLGPSILDGNPGLWCDGNQQADTTDATGSFCDIASSALDIDVGDIDGDFDLDILHGARNEAPRMFANRLDGSSLAPSVGGGQLGFRDVTGIAFSAGYYEGSIGHYEEEMGDFDGDGDLDIYGLNWNTQGFNFYDNVMRNRGDGTFETRVILPGSTDDDNEGDFFDADNDGDLDIYVADFSGQDRLYTNTDGNGSYALGQLPSFSSVSLDADCCDVDNDGDYDVLVAEDNFSANTFLENVSNVPDTSPPYIPRVEDVANRLAGPGSIPVRAQVYDNAPYYITWYNRTRVQLWVDGCRLPDVPAMSSAGQIFRAELPGNLVGNVGYRFVSSDEYGNTGRSGVRHYQTRRPLLKRLDTPGDAPDVSLATAVEYGAGTPGTLGTPELAVPTVVYPGAPLYLLGRNAPPGTPYMLLVTTAPADRLLGNGARVLVGGTVLSRQRGVTDEQGHALLVAGRTPADLPSGVEVYAQFAVLEGNGERWALSPGVRITSQ